MWYQRPYSDTRGFTLVEMLVTAAVMALVFGGLITSIQSMLRLLSTSKSTTSAISLANERIEYIRSLRYADVGTAGGIPNGLIPQNSTTSLNGLMYHERVVVQYVDSPDDELGSSDANGILADYKEVKVEYSWSGLSGTSTIFLLTNVVPQGIESTDGGGTLTVNVFDAQVQPVTGAEVHIYNDTTTSIISTSRYTNSNGVAMFAGAPAAANYEITVSKLGYSTDQTYSATTSNPSPITPHIAVLESAVSTMNFQIDELSDLRVRTVGPATTDSFSDDFIDMSAVVSNSDVTLSAGEIILAGGAGFYAPVGTIESTSTVPSTITGWNTFDWSSVVPANTTLTVQLYAVSVTNTYTLIPDADLPGNSVGFTTGPVTISGLNPATYPSLALGAVLTSSDANVTPVLQDWLIGYTILEPGIGNIPFVLTSTKLIGSTPIYKYQKNHTTDGGGELQINNLEWDSYNLTLSTGLYDIAVACPDIPYILNPNVQETLTLTIVPSVAYSLRVSVVDIEGNPIIGADVDLSRVGFSDSNVTSTCGQVFFNSGLTSTSDYSVAVHASGYIDQTITDITVDGTNALSVRLTQI